jgi:hypothetical protein
MALRTAAAAAATLSAIALLSASAQAATLQQRIYNIFTSEYRAELAFTPAELHANLTAAQPKLAATASKIDALSSTNATAATDLIDELEAQYEVTGVRPLFKAALAAYRALVKLPLTAEQHRQAVLAMADVKHALGINTARDIGQWTAGGFAAGSEPSETKEFGTILGVTLPSIDLPVSASTAAIERFTKLEDTAGTRTSADFTTASDDWGTWIAAFGVESG